MTKEIEMLCLANSVKHRQRCVAGVDLDTGEWIRPVSPGGDGSLSKNQYTTESGRITRPLDTIKLKFKKPAPKTHQPENWIVSGEDNWKFLTNKAGPQQLSAFDAALQQSGKIVSTEEDSISTFELNHLSLPRSLTLISPNEAEFYVRNKEDSSDQDRVEFDFDGHTYDFSITDPRWRTRLGEDHSSDLPSADAVDDDRTLFFTVSLADRYKGYHNKIVATVFALDNDLVAKLENK